MEIINFTYRSNDYQALVKRAYNNDEQIFKITIMNGELEKLLHGKNKFVFKNGEFEVDQNITSDEQQELLKALQITLISYLREPAIF